MVDQAAESESTIGKSRRYFAESVEELRKVTRPTRQETVQATLVTVIIMLFVSVCLFILDLVFNGLMTAILS